MPSSKPLPLKQDDSPDNRRILAVDDDEAVLAKYQQIVTAPAESTTTEHLFKTLNQGIGNPDNSSAPSFKRSSYLLDCFSQGEDAVHAVEQSLLEQQPYTVALIDMRMLPGIDGLETARQIREIDPAIQLIFVTAYSDYTTDEIFHQISGAVLWLGALPVCPSLKKRWTSQQRMTIVAVENSVNGQHHAYTLCHATSLLRYSGHHNRA